jgi:hypothetical protein
LKGSAANSRKKTRNQKSDSTTKIFEGKKMNNDVTLVSHKANGEPNCEKNNQFIPKA